MGSTGKSTVYSDVDTKRTPMSQEDADIMANDNALSGYFQSPNSFDMNSAMRYAVEQGKPLDDVLDTWIVDPTKRADIKRTIETMDRNMQPVNKDMDVVRTANEFYIERVLEKAGFDNKTIARISYNVLQGNGYNPADIQAMKDALVGGKIYENAYISTTYDTSLDSLYNSIKYGRNVHLQMKVKKGTKGIFNPNKKESEFVVDRHTGYTIKDVRLSDDGKIIFVVET